MQKNFTGSKYLKYLFWLGPILIVVGLSAGFVAPTWGPIPLAILLAGMVITGLWLFLQGWGSPTFWSRRSTQVSTNALAATLAVLVILGLINFLGARYVTRLDLTENQLFTLAPQSRQLVRNLKQPVKTWVFISPASDLATQTRVLLEQYRRQGREFSFEFVDPQSQPGLVQEFGVKQEGDIYLEVGDRRQLIHNLQTDRLTESDLTNGLERITRDRQDKVYFLQGHGERSIDPTQQASLSQAVEQLQDKSFVSEPLNLLDRGTVPEDATVVVIAGPRQALLDKEVQAIRTYVQQGGGLLVLADPNTNPGLSNLLKEWGVTLDDRLVINASSRQTVEFGPAAPVVNQYGNHPITQEFGDRFSIYPLARPLEVTSIPGIESTPIVITDEQSWAESDPQNEDLKFNQGSDRPGPLVLGVALSKPVTPTTTPSPAASPSPTASPSPSPTASPSPTDSPSPEASPSPTASPSPSPPANPAAQSETDARLVVLGNSSFATNGLFTQQLNGDVFLNSITWLSNREEEVLSIRPKEARNRRITLTGEQSNLLSLTAIGILPLIAFVAAGWVWWLRR